jgi:WD40 repeat protein
MSRRSLLSLPLTLIVALSISVSGSHAQGDTPQAVYDALADLSARAGVALSLNNLTSWTWNQVNFPDSSLGCPQAGQSYAQVLTNGYRIVFVYNGATFDYRAPVGGAVFLCSGPASVPQAAPVPTFTPAPSAGTTTGGDATGRSVCPDAMNTRLDVGDEARVRVTGLPVNLRSSPTASSTRLASIQPDETFIVSGGPNCAEGLVWWQVTYGLLSGWAAEGANELYWIAPGDTTGVSTPGTSSTTGEPQVFTAPGAEQPPLTAANIGQLVRLYEFPIGDEVVTDTAWSPDGQYLAVAGQTGIHLYVPAAIQLAPRYFRLPKGPVNGIAFSPDATLMVSVHNDTTVRLWDINTGGQRAVLRGHIAPVLCVAVHPNGELVASASADGQIILWEVASRYQLATLAGHTAAVNSVAFSPDGTLLLSAADDNTARLWNVASATAGTVISGHAAAVEQAIFHPNGTLVVSAGAGGVIRTFDIVTGEQTALDTESGPISALAYTLDASLLVTAQAMPDGDVATAIGFWDPVTSTALPKPADLNFGPDVAVASLSLTPDSTLLIIGTTDGTHSAVSVWGIVP